MKKKINGEKGKLGPSDRSISMREWHHAFNFLDRLHEDKQHKAKEMLGEVESRTLLADIAAATIARLLRADAMGKPGPSYIGDDVILHALKCCEAIIYSNGYGPTSGVSLHDTIAKDCKNVMLVVGCQGDDIRDARVKTAFEVTKRLHNIGFTVIFSGWLPPSPKKVRCPNESADMRATFESLIEEDKDESFYHRPHIIEINSEKQSQTTSENIQKFFEMGIIDENKKVNIFLISSTFHLIRLSKEFEKYLKESDNLELIEKFRSVILAGSEGIRMPLSDVSYLYNYVKPMLFEVYNYLLSNSIDYEPLFGAFPPNVTK